MTCSTGLASALKMSSNTQAALLSLDFALSLLHSTPRPAVHLPFEAPPSQAFTRLALSASILWSQVTTALQHHYSNVDPGQQLAGDYGAPLVRRVLARFTQFQYPRDEEQCLAWCRILEEHVWNAV